MSLLGRCWSRRRLSSNAPANHSPLLTSRRGSKSRNVRSCAFETFQRTSRIDVKRTLLMPGWNVAVGRTADLQESPRVGPVSTPKLSFRLRARSKPERDIVTVQTLTQQFGAGRVFDARRLSQRRREKFPQSRHLRGPAFRQTINELQERYGGACLNGTRYGKSRSLRRCPCVQPEASPLKSYQSMSCSGAG
jgi:hypothetical protein